MDKRGRKSKTDKALAVFGMTPPKTEAGIRVFSRDRQIKGKTTGGCYRCRMEGCTGIRIGVRWETGQITFPCSKGMRRNKDHWRIL